MRGLHFLCVLVVLYALSAAPAAAQSVFGRVIDAQSGQPIAGVVLRLVAGETLAAEAISGQAGAFQLVSLRPGEYRIQASHVAYRTTLTDPLRLGIEEQLVVEVKLSAAAIPLDPLVITARRADPRYDPTVEGFYARQQLLPPIGNSRALTRLDPELAYARDARDVQTWLAPPRRFRGTATNEGQGCLIVYWSGQVAFTPETAEMYLQTAATELEGIEYYRLLADAPFPFRTVPPYLFPCPQHSVLALWPRTGYYGDLPADDPPSQRRLSAASAMYYVAGSNAPGVGVGVEGAAHWPIRRRVALGVNVRWTTHHLSAETTSALLAPVVAPPFAMPPGRRPLALWVGGVESRALLRETAGIWPVVAARLQVARRSYSMRSTSFETADVPITSTGYGFGVTVGGEVVVWDRFALHAAVGHDRLFFGPYDEIEHRINPTSANWGGTAIRFGIGYALDR